MNRPASTPNSRPRVLHVVTSPLTLHMMRGQLRFLREQGFEVFIASAPGSSLEEIARDEGVTAISVPMVRSVSPWNDLCAFWRLWRLMRKLRPTLTNVGTPKAGLLGGLAAWLAGVPCRIYTLRGLRLETERGLKRRLLQFAEWLACRTAHRVVCVSESLRQLVVELGLVPREHTVVLGVGSSNGVDVSHFAPTLALARRAQALRRRLGVPRNAMVLGFVGRMTPDKGVPELLMAYMQVRRSFPRLYLLLIGSWDEEDPLPADVRHIIETDPQILYLGVVADPTVHYTVMNLFVLPTHREGFPNVLLEAHAAGKAVVTTRATGAIDAVTDGVTGMLVPVGDVAALTDALARLLRDPDLAHRMGRAGRERVSGEFRAERVWAALAQEYDWLLERHALPRSTAVTAGTPTKVGPFWRVAS